MPFETTAELPARIRKLSPKKQRQFMKVFNSAFKRAPGNTKAKEGAAFRQANSAISAQFVNPGGEGGQRELMDGMERDQAIQDLRKMRQWHD